MSRVANVGLSPESVKDPTTQEGKGAGPWTGTSCGDGSVRHRRRATARRGGTWWSGRWHGPQAPAVSEQEEAGGSDKPR